jgi:hypothetical protein
LDKPHASQRVIAQNFLQRLARGCFVKRQAVMFVFMRFPLNFYLVNYMARATSDAISGCK